MAARFRRRRRGAIGAGLQYGIRPIQRRTPPNPFLNPRDADRRWEAFHQQYARKYKWVPQYNIKGLTYEEWYKKTRLVADERGRTHEQVMRSPYYRWKKNPAFARLDEIRDNIKREFEGLVQLRKQQYRLHKSILQRGKRTFGLIYPRGSYERNYFNRQSWRIYRHQGLFMNLGPAGFFSENTIIRIELSPDIATFAQIIYPSITDDRKAIIKLQDDIINKVILPIIRKGVILIMKYVPMMSGELRKTMLDALRNYKKFQFPEIYVAEVFVHTIGLMYSRPVNNMPTSSLAHPKPDSPNYRSKNRMLYRLHDPDAVTEWFQKVVEELRDYGKERWRDFEAFLLRALTNFRLLNNQEAIFNPNIAEREHNLGADIAQQTGQIQAIVAEMFPRLRNIDVIMSKYQLMKSLKENILPSKRNLEGYNRTQQHYIDSLIEESLFDENPRKLNTKSFIQLFIKVKHSGGSMR